MTLDGWKVATGFVRADGEVLHTAIDPLTVEFVHAFPHRVEVWTAEGTLLAAAGCLDDSGRFVTCEHEETADGTPVIVVVDILGVDEQAPA